MSKMADEDIIRRERLETCKGSDKTWRSISNEKPVAFFAIMDTGGWTMYGSGTTVANAMEAVRKVWADRRDNEGIGYESDYGDDLNSTENLNDYYGIRVYPVIPGEGALEV